MNCSKLYWLKGDHPAFDLAYLLPSKEKGRRVLFMVECRYTLPKNHRNSLSLQEDILHKCGLLQDTVNLVCSSKHFSLQDKRVLVPKEAQKSSMSAVYKIVTQLCLVGCTSVELVWVLAAPRYTGEKFRNHFKQAVESANFPFHVVAMDFEALMRCYGPTIATHDMFLSVKELTRQFAAKEEQGAN
jgi:hypothetical protein